jgi:outer membrane protein assembly factor BamE (lipoprotein component of BamABCDE complex)
MRPCATLIALLLFAASCSPIVNTRGHNEDTADLSQLVIGQSRSEDVAALLGSPSAESRYGQKTWYYISEKQETQGMLPTEVIEQKVVKVTFDDNDTIASIDGVDQEKARDVSMVQKTTPTEGRSMTMIEQIMGNLGRFNAPGRQIDPRNLGR